MRYVAIAFLALAALRCKAGDFTGSALEITRQGGGTDHRVWEQVDKIVSSVGREHRLIPGPVNRNRPDYLLEEKLYYTYYPSSSGTTLTVYLRSELRRPIEIEITETGVSHPSHAHRALLADLRHGLSRNGFSVKRGEARIIVTD